MPFEKDHLNFLRAANVKSYACVTVMYITLPCGNQRCLSYHITLDAHSCHVKTSFTLTSS